MNERGSTFENPPNTVKFWGGIAGFATVAVLLVASLNPVGTLFPPQPTEPAGFCPNRAVIRVKIAYYHRISQTPTTRINQQAPRHRHHLDRFERGSQVGTANRAFPGKYARNLLKTLTGNCAARTG